MLIDPFGNPFRPAMGTSQSDLFRRRGGGAVRPRKSEAAPESEPESEPDAGPEGEAEDPSVEESPGEKVVLKNPRWEVEKVGFNEETSISVEAVLPENLAHKTKVAFELFAKTPAGDESISKADGTLSDGKAVAKIPVYIPQYRDEEGSLLSQVDYYFSATHSASDPLKDDTVLKHVDEMAGRVLDSHIVAEATFDTGKSQVRPDKARSLQALADRVVAWKEKHPDGKLAVFGHADAEGREESNKKLSERRARSIHAFLMMDASAWEALAQEEKWDRKALPDFKAFMEENNPLSLSAKDFDSIDGKAFTGCGEYNLAEAKAGPHAPNRRVAVFLLKSNRNFPNQYPCKHGAVAPCKAQAGRKGVRRTQGFRCHFYDTLVAETQPLHGDFEVLLHIDAENPRAKDDTLLLVDEDGTEVKTLKVAEMQEEGEDRVRLRFEGVDMRKRYSLVRDNGPDEEGGRDAFWINLSPEEIIALSADPEPEPESDAQ